MKKIISSNICLFILVCSFTSCKDFLNEQYDNRVVFDNIEKIEQLIVNSYPLRMDLWTDIMTDDYHHYSNSMQASLGDTWVPLYLWKDNYTKSGAANPDEAYRHYYEKIYDVNNVIELLAEGGHDNRISKALLGEALVLRAYGHFSLVNLFGMHYNENTASTDLGVPIITEVNKENRPLFSRSTVREVYDQIEKDLHEGTILLEEVRSDLSMNPYRFSLASVYAFRSRIALYKGQWNEAIEFANKVIQDRGVVVRKLSEDLHRQRTTTEAYFASEIMNPTIHKNLLLVVHKGTAGMLNTPIGFRIGGFFVDHSISNNRNMLPLDGSDLRRRLLADAATVIDSVQIMVKYANQPNNPMVAQSRYDCFTMEEVLLNRAEANLRSTAPRIESAMADVEAIRKERIVPYQSLPIPNTIDEALTVVLKERRLELLGQGFRWYDIKRLNLRVEHRLNRRSANPDAVLTEDDKRKAIQIPVDALVGNPELENQMNPR